MHAIDHTSQSFYDSGAKLKPEASGSYLTSLCLFIADILEVISLTKSC